MPMDHAEVLQDRPVRTVRFASALVMLFLVWVFLPGEICLGQTAPPIVATTRTMLSDNNPVFASFKQTQTQGVPYNVLSFGMQGTFGSLAVNQAGDLLQGGYNWNAVWDFPANGGTPFKVFTDPSSDHTGPIAVDSNGNVVVTGVYGNITTMIPYVNGSYTFYSNTTGYEYSPPNPPTPPLCTGTIANGVVTVTSTSACTYDYPITYSTNPSVPNGGYITGGNYLEAEALAFDPEGDSFLLDNYNQSTIYGCSIECNFGTAAPTEIVNFVNPTTTSTAGSCYTVSDFNWIADIAADSSGNVYFTNMTGTIYEVAAGTGSATAVPTVFSNAFIAAEGVSFDSAGNMYVADNGNTSGKFSNYTCVSTGGGGLWEIPLVNGVLDPAKMFMILPLGTGSQSNVNSQNQWGVAIDQHGNIFAEQGYTDIWKYTVGNAPFAATAVGSNSNPVPLTLTFNAPVTLQSTTISAAGAPSKDFSVVTSGNVNATASLTVPIPPANFQILPSAISLDLTPGFSATETIGIGQAATFTGNVALAVSGLPTGVTSAFSTDPVTGANILTLTASSSATSGLATLSVYAPFTATVSGKSVTENESAPIILNILPPCVFGAVNAAHTSCVIDVQFSPTQPGQRNATLTLTDASGDNIPVYLTGVGVGQAITVDPGTQSAVGSGLKQPGAVAVDGAGNVFVADAGANAVYEFAGGTGAGTALGSGLKEPGGVATDSAGNLYISDTGNNRVVEIPNGSGGPYTGSQSNLLTGLNKPGQLAVDGTGTLYIPEAGNNDVVTYVNRSGLTSGGVTTVPVTAAAGLESPSAVALDASNNLYIASPASNTVVEYSDGSISNVGANLSAPMGVAVDGSGSVIIASRSNGLIVRVPNQNGGLASSYQTIITSSILNPDSVALDQYGNLFASDSTNAAAYGMNRLSGAINFGKVNDQSSSAGQTAVIASSGLASLTVGSPFYPSLAGTPFEIPSSSDNCSSLSALASGYSCTLETYFDPTTQAGLQSYTVDFSSGAQNTAAPSLLLSGNAVNELPSIVALAQTLPATGNASYGSPVTITATVTPASGTGTTATGTVQFIVDGGNSGQPVAMNGAAQASIVLSNLSGGTHLIAASYSGDKTYAPSSSSPLTVTISPATSSTALSVFGFAAGPLTAEPSPPEIADGDSFTMTASIVPSIAGSLSGSVVFSNGVGGPTLGTATIQSTTTSGSGTAYTAVLTLSGTNGTMLPVGVYNIVATYGGNNNYGTSTSSATQLIVTQPTFTMAQSNSAITSSAKSPGTSTITITSESAFTGGVDFTCTGLPVHATCNFVPAVLGLAVNTNTTPPNATYLVPVVSTTLTVKVNQAPIITPTGIFWWAGLLLGLGIFGLAGNRNARRRLLIQSLAACILLVSLAGVSGCGSGTAAFTTPSGTSTVTITATSTPPSSSGIPNPALNVVQTVQFTLTVQ